MQQRERTVRALFLTVIYCLTVGLTPFLSSVADGSLHVSGHKQYLITSAATSLVSHTGNVQRLTVDLSEPETRCISDPTHYPEYTPRLIQRLWLTVISLRESRLANWPMVYGSVDIAYPFHSFW